MKRRLYAVFAFCFLCFACGLSAQPGWIQDYEPFQMPLMDYSYDSGNIKVLDDGCFVVNGTCAESDDLIGWYSEFGFLIKFDSDGNIIWAQRDSLSSSPDLWECQSEAFAVLPDGGFVSAGSVGLINPDYLLFRDSEGNLDHIVYYNNMNYQSMCVVDNGQALLFAGSSGGSTLQKTDLSGNEIWRQNYSEYNSTSIVSVVQCSDGGYAFLSFTYSNFDYCLVKTDSSGTVEWSQTYDYNGQNDIPRSLLHTSDGGYLLCGYTGDTGGFIVKADAVGDTLWTRKYDPSYCARVWCSTLSNNNIVLHGYATNGIMILIQIDELGNTLWYKEINDTGYTTAEQNMQKCSDGFIIFLEWIDDVLLIKTDENGVVAIDGGSVTPKPISCLNCYPNPFNPTTTIGYSIPAAAAVELSIYNVKGQKVVTLVNQHQEAGEYSTQWNGTDEQNNSVASGVYFYKLSDDSGRSSVQKCLLLK